MDRVTIEDIDEICESFEKEVILEVKVLERLIATYQINEDNLRDFSHLIIIILHKIYTNDYLADFYKRFLFALRDIKHGNLNQVNILSLYDGTFEYEDDHLLLIQVTLVRYLVINEDFIHQRISFLYNTIPSSLTLNETFQKRMGSFVHLLNRSGSELIVYRNTLCRFILLNNILEFDDRDDIKAILYEALSVLHHPTLIKDKTKIHDLLPQKIINVDDNADALFNRISASCLSLSKEIELFKSKEAQGHTIILALNYMLTLLR